MGKAEFRKYLEDKGSVEEDGPPVDWEEQKRDWIIYVESLYSQIHRYTTDFREQGKIKEERRKIVLSEENIGDYEIDELILNVAGTKVVFHPIGTLLIGAKGRVDMTSSKGVVKFVLVPKDASEPKIIVTVSVGKQSLTPTLNRKNEQPSVEWAWKIALTDRNFRYIELSEDSFFTALMEVVNA